MPQQAAGGVQASPTLPPTYATVPWVYITASPDEVAAWAAAGSPVPPGAMLVSPTTRLVYGQSDGVGGYVALGAAGSFTIASQAEAEAGTDNTKGMTPLRTAQAIAAQAAAGASGLAFPSDPSAVGADAASITVDGVAHAMAYNPDDSAASDTVELTAADDLVRTVSYGPKGTPYYSGNVFRQGSQLMTVAQAAAFVAEVLAPAGAAANGTQLRISDLFYTTTTASATPVYHEGVLEWQVHRLRPISGCVFDVWHNATHVANNAESGALSSIVLPRWLCRRGYIWRNRVIHEAAGGSASALRTRIKVNGTAYVNINSGSGASASNGFELDLHCVGDAAQFYAPSVFGGTGGTGSTGAALGTGTVDTASNDLTVSATGEIAANDASRVITSKLHRLELLS